MTERKYFRKEIIEAAKRLVEESDNVEYNRGIVELVSDILGYSSEEYDRADVCMMLGIMPTDKTVINRAIKETERAIARNVLNGAIEAGITHVVNQLSGEDLAYALDIKRGEFRGFAALHDLMDANMLLPGMNGEGPDELPTDYYNAVTDGFNAKFGIKHDPPQEDKK